MSPIYLHLTVYAVVLLVLPLTDPAFAGEPKPASGQTDCVEEVALRVQAWADRVPGIEARFEQTTELVALAGGNPPPPTTSSGRVHFAKPGRMRFDYEEPERSQVVSDGRELWIYDVEAGEVQHLQTTAEYLNGAALQFLMGEGKLLENFEVSAKHCGVETVELDLVPRADASYERLGLRVRRSSGEVLETTLNDLFGNQTRIRFEGTRSDRAPEASLFRFVVPSGVEVIELRPPP